MVAGRRDEAMVRIAWCLEAGINGDGRFLVMCDLEFMGSLVEFKSRTNRGGWGGRT